MRRAAVALLRAGARVDSRARDGATALHFAALHGDEATCRLLLEHGAAMTLGWRRVGAGGAGTVTGANSDGGASGGDGGDGYLRFTFTSATEIILDVETCRAREHEVLERNAIPARMSDDLAAIFGDDDRARCSCLRRRGR